MIEQIKSAIFAGGCFWCTEAVFNRIDGVEAVVSGYTGGFIKNPAYREVCSGSTGHAEGIKISYNPEKVSYIELLEVFFATHDPTTLNRQANDVGTQYRSAIFYTSESQKSQAQDYISLLTSEMVFSSPIVTEITKFEVFYEADDNHKAYYNNNTEQPYCQIMIRPKLNKLEQHFGDKLKK